MCFPDMVDAQLIISARQLLRVDRLEYKGDDLATVEQVLEEMAKYIDAPFGL